MRSSRILRILYTYTLKGDGRDQDQRMVRDRSVDHCNDSMGLVLV
jgi:hypothetical protein